MVNHQRSDIKKSKSTSFLITKNRDPLNAVAEKDQSILIGNLTVPTLEKTYDELCKEQCAFDKKNQDFTFPPKVYYRTYLDSFFRIKSEGELVGGLFVITIIVATLVLK